jgi:hypothetical protein
MSHREADKLGPAPRWLVIVGSVLIVFHLSAILFRVLAAPSGPWPGMDGGPERTMPPQLALSLDQLTAPYLKAVRMTHNYHFPTDQPVRPGIHVEIRLKDESGQELARVRLPDENANPWVRHRQEILANGLGDDVPVRIPGSELVPAVGREVEQVDYWVFNMNELTQRRDRKPINQFDRTQAWVRPSDQADLLAGAYVRYLCRQHGADRAEVIRYHKNPIPPAVLVEDLPGGMFGQWTSFFGEYTRDGKPIR